LPRPVSVDPLRDVRLVGFSCRRRFSNEDGQGDLTPFYVGLLVDAVLYVTKTLVDCVASTVATMSKQTMVLLCGQQVELGAAGSLLVTVWHHNGLTFTLCALACPALPARIDAPDDRRCHVLVKTVL